MLARRLPRSLRLFSTQTQAWRIHSESSALRPHETLDSCPHSWRVQARTYATPPPQLNLSELSSKKYHKLSDATMERLLESLEDLLDRLQNSGYEVEYHSGVLTLGLGSNGTYVINKQPPNKQIWLSSPISGPIRYDYSEAKKSWLYSRDGHALDELLNRELSKVLGGTIKLDLRIDESDIE